MKNAVLFLQELSARIPPPRGRAHSLVLTLHTQFAEARANQHELSVLLWIPTDEDPDYSRCLHFDAADLERDPAALAEEISHMDLLDLYRMMQDLRSMLGTGEDDSDKQFCLKIASYLPLVHVDSLLRLFKEEDIEEIIPMLRNLMLAIAEGFVPLKPDGTPYTEDARDAARLLATGLPS